MKSLLTALLTVATILVPSSSLRAEPKEAIVASYNWNDGRLVTIRRRN